MKRARQFSQRVPPAQISCDLNVPGYNDISLVEMVPFLALGRVPWVSNPLSAHNLPDTISLWRRSGHLCRYISENNSNF